MDLIECFLFAVMTREVCEGDKCEGPFAKYFFGTIMKTFTLFIGELNYDDVVHTFGVDLDNAKNETGSFWSKDSSRLALKTQLALGQLIFIVFVFLFVIVVLNLLNGIAISDIQVTY